LPQTVELRFARRGGGLCESVVSVVVVVVAVVTQEVDSTSVAGAATGAAAGSRQLAAMAAATAAEGTGSVGNVGAAAAAFAGVLLMLLLHSPHHLAQLVGHHLFDASRDRHLHGIGGFRPVVKLLRRGGCCLRRGGCCLRFGLCFHRNSRLGDRLSGGVGCPATTSALVLSC